MNSAEKLLIGAIYGHEIALRDRLKSEWRFQTFDISPDKPSGRRIADSAFSSPARYIQEIFVRLFPTRGIDGECARFVFNPFFATTYFSILAVVATLRRRKEFADPAVVADRNGLPVGYLLPKTFKKPEAHFLSLLSTVDTTLDATLLQHLCFSRTTVIEVPELDLSKSGHNGFDDNGMRTIYRWVGQRAISELQRVGLPSAEGTDPTTLMKRRDTIPFAAIMPNHAGDVLFFSLAFNQVTSPYKKIVVNRAYLDILRDTSPMLEPIEIDTDLMNRDSTFAAGNVTRECDYFQAYKDRLPHNNFYTFCRPSRNYNNTDYHLIDHFAFALGSSPYSEDELVIRTREVPQRLTQPSNANRPAKILLHFDAGWPLKVYPMRKQQELIELLLSYGHEITVLAPPRSAYPGTNTESFRTLPHFATLARAHDILVGMDSFPCHYSTHILGLPTICLFASTKPVNSNARTSGHYAYLEQGLKCRPCYAIKQCPVYGGSECRNFVAPTLVASQIQAILTGSADIPKDGLTISSTPAPPTTRAIHLRLMEVQLWFANMLPSISSSNELASEFLKAIKREGLDPAVRRTFRFLVRKFRSLS